MPPKSDPNSKLIAENRRARFDYFVEDTLEAGIALMGSEVKSLRAGAANIGESYASVEGGELWPLIFLNSSPICLTNSPLFGAGTSLQIL